MKEPRQHEPVAVEGDAVKVAVEDLVAAVLPRPPRATIVHGACCPPAALTVV